MKMKGTILLQKQGSVVKIPVMGLWTLRTFSSGTPSNADTHWGFKNSTRSGTTDIGNNEMQC